MHFQEPVLTCNVALHDKSGITPFYNVRKEHVKSIQEYKNLSWVWGADRNIRPRVTVWTEMSGVISDPEGRIFLPAPKNHDRFFFLHTLWSLSFDLNVEAVINESYSCTLTSTILKADVPIDLQWGKWCLHLFSFFFFFLFFFLSDPFYTCRKRGHA